MPDLTEHRNPLLPPGATELTRPYLRPDVQVFYTLPEWGGHQAAGTVEILGVSFHMQAIRVVEKPNKIVPGGWVIEPADDAPEEIHEIYDSMQMYYSYVPHTVHLPGLEGEWCLFIHPHGR